MIRSLFSVAYATGWGAGLKSWRFEATDSERQELERDLAWLVRLGHVVAFHVSKPSETLTALQLREVLVARFGDLTMEAIRGQPLMRPEPAAAFLAAVGPFTRDKNDVLSSTLRFLNTEAEVLAFPSFDDEAGFPLPGREGLYLPLFMPRFDRQSSVI